MQPQERMIFVANDSLSELVWSPHKGLSIRCAVGISIPTSKDDRNMTTFQLGQECESGSSGSMNTSSRLNSVEDDTVAVNEAIESSSPGHEGGLRNILPAGDKLECVAENDLPPSEQFQLEVCEISRAAPITTLASEKKGKEKTMSNDDLKKKEESQDDDDSYESVESCNSARQVSAGKKRVLSFNEQLIVKSKRLKMQIRENPGCSSSTRSNSSFANWISAMVKGLSRPNEDLETLAHLNTRNEKKVLNISSSEQNKTSGNNMGFQSIFQSIYQPNPKVQNERLLCTDNYQRSEGFKQLKLAEKSGEANSNPVRSNSDDLLALKDNTSKSLSQSVLKGNVASDLLDFKTDVSSKRFCLNPDSTATRDAGSSKNFITRKRATDISGKSWFDLPSEEKLVHASVKKDDHLSNLFISHFCPKSARPVTNSAHHKQGPMGNVECDAGSSRLKFQGSSSEVPTNSSSYKKLHNFPVDVEASCSVKEVEAQNINQIVHFQGFQSSEAMVSVFAKRLDALKNIMSTELTDKSASSATTCFFCGVTGHDLRYCPRLTETEVDELLRNMTAYGGKEESPCLCIRCFQLNHWAVACPNAPSLKKNKVEDSEIWYRKGFVRNLSLHVDLEMKENEESIEKVPSNLRKVSATISEENASELPWFPYPCGSLSMPKGIFEAVKSLQLSRTDIMKWMHSIFSTSLDGYYLRLRQKIGDGLGGTQYHVACICSPQEGKSGATSKRPIYVTVGGIKCSVESQYISNQDFLEDELKAWWSATLRGDHGKIPSEDELRSKVEERRRLGL